MKRKDFIKQSCLACMGIATAGFIVEGMTSCATFPVIKAVSDEKMVSVSLEQLKLNPMNIIRPSMVDFDIFISVDENNKYNCLVLKCTHQDWNLISNPKGFNCSLHGSMFDLKGKVLNGPATKPLVKLENEEVGAFLKIKLS